MSQCISKRPLIVKVAPSKQHDRLDTIYYHPKFNDLEAALAMLGRELIPAEQIAELITDGTHQTPSYIEPGNDSIPLLSSTNIKENGIEINDLKHISLQEHLSLKKSNPKPNDVLLSVAGNIGTAAVFHGELDACSLLRSVALIRLKDAWEPEFVAVFINSKIGKLQIERLQKGIAVKTFRLGEINEFCLPLTTPPEQSCIIERYNHIRGKRREIEARISRCRHKQYVQSSKRIDNLFAKELGFPKFNHRKNRKVFLRKNINFERLDVPSNHPDYLSLVAKIKTSAISGYLGDIVDVSEDRFNPRGSIGETVHYLNITEINGLKETADPQVLFAEDVPSQGRKLIRAGDVIVGSITTGDEKMSVFHAKEENDGWVASSDIHILRPKPGVKPEYIVRLLKAPFVLFQIKSLLYGAAIKRISENELLRLSVPILNTEEQDKILHRLADTISEAKKSIEHLANISDECARVIQSAKCNIFDLLNDSNFQSITESIDSIKQQMETLEEALQ